MLGKQDDVLVSHVLETCEVTYLEGAKVRDSNVNGTFRVEQELARYGYEYHAQTHTVVSNTQ